MLSFNPIRIYLHREATDMRKSFNGLSSLVSMNFPEADLDGTLFVFLNKRQTYVKCLYWDQDGYVIWSKQLRQGCFKKLDSEGVMISRRELLMLLEGIKPKRLNKRFSMS